MDGKCAINAFLCKKVAVFAPIAGTTNYENRLTIGCYSQPITVHMLLADRTEEEYFGVKVSLEFGQAVNTTVSKHI